MAAQWGNEVAAFDLLHVHVFCKHAGGMYAGGSAFNCMTFRSKESLFRSKKQEANKEAERYKHGLGCQSLSYRCRARQQYQATVPGSVGTCKSS